MKKKNLFSVLFTVALAFALPMSFSSCNGDNNDPDPDDGKTDPSTIATANLVAYFPFESESASIVKGEGITFGKKAGAASFVTGRRGNAYKGSASQAYLEYNVASVNPFTAMTEFTMAAWIKTPPANGAAKIFGLNGGDDFMGNIVLMIEGGSNADSLDIKAYLYNSSTEWKGQDIRHANEAFLSDKWVHIAFSYNKTTSNMTLYASGMPVFYQTKYSGPEVGGQQPLLGSLTFGSGITKIQFGVWPQMLDGAEQDWMKYFPGLIDEFRIYNKALTDAEIKALYDAEVTQIN